MPQSSSSSSFFLDCFPYRQLWLLVGGLWWKLFGFGERVAVLIPEGSPETSQLVDIYKSLDLYVSN
jgi:hypothetical protein